MDDKDAALIKAFVERIKEAIPEIDCIVLFGSAVQDTLDKRSDIDIMIIMNNVKNPIDYLPKVSETITSLKPHREVQCTLTNLRDYDATFLQNVLAEGKVLFGKVVLSADDLLLRPYRLIAYDLKGVDARTKVKVSRFVHGAHSKKNVGGKQFTYRYKGLKDKEGAIDVSPSTILLPEDEAQKFTAFLRELRIKFFEKRIWLQG